ncbi:hypothetical protein KILIM_089_00010 [Kineosphaera limosa NBRC 100340]|uniref:Uncharacterized protein n=1 Tax=Kineosphaera limosa NBRC 100340 TaxID=1184609 RepID=K6WVT2_9MICO|nr:hypothetical protein KILIM_089_00010 [Kineosphaera limosa NBRC 100340]
MATSPAVATAAAPDATPAQQHPTEPDSPSIPPARAPAPVEPTAAAPTPFAPTAAAPTAAPPTAVAPAPPGRAPSYRTGDYLLVLESLPINQYDYASAQARAGRPGLTVVDSGTVPGLNPGYWAVVSTAGYSSERAARAACSDFGRTPSGACYPRRVGG